MNIIRVLWDHIKTSLWIYPLLISILYALIAIIMLLIDDNYGYRLLNYFPSLYINTEGARQVLSVTASSMITVTGVAFSVSVVTLSLASNQFGPKILRNYLSDTTNKVSLGLLIGVFIYGVVALVFMSEQNNSGPFFTLAVNFILTIIAIMSLIYFIHNISTTIQADHILAAVAKDLESTIISTLGQEECQISKEFENEWKSHVTNLQSNEIKAKQSGYIQSIDYEEIMKTACKYDYHVELDTRAGKFLISQETIGHCYSTQKPDKNFFEKIDNCIFIGLQRTPIQDLEFSIDQLVQVGLRALSPGINDSSTAITCIHWLSASIGMMTNRYFPSYHLRDQQGTARLTAKEFSFASALEAAFNPLRQNSQGNIMVQITLLESLIALLKICRTEQKNHLYKQAKAIYETPNNITIKNIDLEAIKQRFNTFQSIYHTSIL